MYVKVIGCHGSVSPGYRTTCYDVSGSFLIDAGSICSALTPHQQKEVTDIFITHPHMDHIKDICFLLENTFSKDRKPLTLRSIKGVLDALHTHIFNDIIWPDFSKIHVNNQEPLLKFQEIKGSAFVNGYKVTPFKVNHFKYAVGYLVDDGSRQVLFTGDTGPCKTIWEVANQCPNLVAIFTEITFPSRMEKLARASCHYTLDLLLNDIKGLKKKEVPFYISHLKPLFLEETLEEFSQKAPDYFHLLHEDDECRLDV